MAGIFSLAWKILRGAEVASTDRAMVEELADQAETTNKTERQTTPKILESFIFKPPFVSMTAAVAANPTAPAEF